MKKRRNITLIEIMVVILLIGIIGGTLAVNMRGSLDKGKAFKTEQNMKRIEEIIELAYADGVSVSKLANDWEKLVKKSPLVNGAEVVVDGWKKSFNVKVSEDIKKGLIVSVQSDAYDAYVEKHG